LNRWAQAKLVVLCAALFETRGVLAGELRQRGRPLHQPSPLPRLPARIAAAGAPAPRSPGPRRGSGRRGGAGARVAVAGRGGLLSGAFGHSSLRLLWWIENSSCTVYPPTWAEQRCFRRSAGDVGVATAG